MQEVFPESRAARSFPAGGTRWGAGGGRSGGAAASRRRWKPEREPRNSRQNAMHKVRAAVGFGGRPALRQDLPPGPTAGYGKPYVRWCGRVPGRNPRYPTRSSGIRCFVSGRARTALAQGSEEFSYVVDEQAGLFHGGEMPASRHLGPLLDVVGGFHPLAGREEKGAKTIKGKPRKGRRSKPARSSPRRAMCCGRSTMPETRPHAMQQKPSAELLTEQSRVSR